MSLEEIIRNFFRVRQIQKESRPQFEKYSDSSSQFDHVTLESVGSQDPDGTVNVRGYRIAPFGKVLLSAGEQVYVGWKGTQPVGILKLAWQKAHFAPVSVSLRKGIVEELFIAVNAGRTDVYFRNYDQVTALNIGAFIGGTVTPTDVFWGMNEDVFGVMAGTDRYFVLKINRIELDKIIAEGTKVKISELLYSGNLSDTTVTLSNVSVKLHRDSVEPVFKINALYSGFFPTNVTFNGMASTNVNQADVTRKFTVTLTGASTVNYIESSVPTEQGVRTGSVSASLVGVLIDENDQLVYSVSVAFNDFGIRQGNFLGLTGVRRKIGDGRFCTFGFFDIFAQAPHIIDDFPIMGFNLINGNPGGELTAHVDETHSVIVNTQTQAIVFSTIDSIKLLEVHEDTNGQIPYFQVSYTGFIQAIPSPCGDSTAHAYVPDGHAVYNPLYGPIVASQSFGDLGKYGVIRSDRSLFALDLPFDPDGVPRTVQILTNTGEQRKFETERTDGWDTFGGHPGLFFSGNMCLEARWTAATSEIEHRYRVHVTSTPFWAIGGFILHFVSVFQNPLNDPTSPFTTDPVRVGAFVMLDTALIATLLPYTDVTVSATPQYMTGNSHHVVWRLSSNWFITDLDTGLTTQIGTDAFASKVQGLRYLNPDLLYESVESSTTEPFFVNPYRDEVLQLNQADADFPHKAGPPLDKLGILKDLPTGLTPGVKSYQAIDDRTLVPESET